MKVFSILVRELNKCLHELHQGAIGEWTNAEQSLSMLIRQS